MEKGIDAGRRPELVGGGLICSVGGWKIAKMLLKGEGSKYGTGQQCAVFSGRQGWGITATDLARQMDLTQPAISISTMNPALKERVERMEIG